VQDCQPDYQLAIQPEQDYQPEQAIQPEQDFRQVLENQLVQDYLRPQHRLSTKTTFDVLVRQLL
jgi:hypothetical protein